MASSSSTDSPPTRASSPNFADLAARRWAIQRFIVAWHESAHPFRWTDRSFEMIPAKVEGALAAQPDTLAAAEPVYGLGGAVRSASGGM
jgi:hypothetical protein